MPADDNFDCLQKSDATLIQLCKVSPVISGSLYGNRVVKLSDTVVVKYGIGVRKQEADNQYYAYQHVERSILRVPKIFRFFKDTSQGSTVGYIIMEFIMGTGFDSIVTMFRDLTEASFGTPLNDLLCCGATWKQ
ncbi:hypothetical protein K469DRAFT_701148 [Zopfia rhizophila CBS 207.26]|uniref:Protein kinase domain-containing protein n=1 Tax=Zopfia rhizophila CBS 207.26 TaxID=1314779 RepID=A0A6A6EF07_9PEZI|nr:hypothetical protein K469DRAFT_701148 [Zopfia rhizophila CBS 207.26]